MTVLGEREGATRITVEQTIHAQKPAEELTINAYRGVSMLVIVSSIELPPAWTMDAGDGQTWRVERPPRGVGDAH